MYQFSEEDLNYRQFFRFNKKWVVDMNWAMLSLAAKAVLPVILSFDNGKGQSWPSEETISTLSGLSCKTVRKGIDHLLSMAGFSFDWQMTATGRKSKKFKFEVPGKDDPVFFFHKVIFTGGNWRLLKPVGKAVYPVLRSFAAWDKDEAAELADGLGDDSEFKEAYAARQWEYSELMPGDIAKYSGIERARVYGALKDLTNHFFTERCRERWKVFLLPQQYYKRDFLNEQLMKSFSHKLKESEND